MIHSRLLVGALALGLCLQADAQSFQDFIKKGAEALKNGQPPSIASLCSEASTRGLDLRRVCRSLNVLVRGKIAVNLKSPQDREAVGRATDTTLRTGKTETVTTSDGATVTVKAVARSARASPQKPPAVSRDGTGGTMSATPLPAAEATSAPAEAIASTPPVDGECRKVEQTMVGNDGQRTVETFQVCLREGVWIAE